MWFIFQSGTGCMEKIPVFTGRGGTNAEVCVRNMPGQEYMPYTKNKTGLFSEQNETESAGSSPSASHLLYATEEAIQKITPDTDDGRRHTGLRLPWGRDLSGKEAALRQMCSLPSACAVPAEGGSSNRRERRDPAELRADPYFNSGTSPLKGLVIPVLRKRISLSSPENLIISRCVCVSSWRRSVYSSCPLLAILSIA